MLGSKQMMFPLEDSVERKVIYSILNLFVNLTFKFFCCGSAWPGSWRSSRDRLVRGFAFVLLYDTSSFRVCVIY